MQEYVLVLLWFLFGIIISEYVQVISDRGSFLDSLFGRSKCDYCGENIKWYSLIPIFGSLLTGGKTGCCKKRIDTKYITFEIAFTFAWGVILYLLYRFNNIDTIVLLAALLAISTTALLMYEDYKRYSVPITWLLSWAISIVFFWFVLGGGKIFFASSLAFIFVFAFSLLLVRFITKSEKRRAFKDMFGIADFVVLVLLSLLVGFDGVMYVLTATSLASVSLLFIQKRLKLGQKLPLLTTMLPWVLLAVILA